MLARSFKNHGKALRIAVVAAAAALCAGASQAAAVLWYNGDFDSVNGLANERNTTVTDARVYENFVVTDAAGWTLTSLWSNNLMSFTASTADWEIRTGVSAGNGGTLVASGTAAATQTATGRSGFGFTEFRIEVDGLSINLAAGTYWLEVNPVDSGSGRSFVSTTSGANSVGTPAGNDGNSFFNSAFFGSNFDPAANLNGSANYSMGVSGNVNGSVPEPGTLALVGLSLAAMALRRRRNA